MFKQSQSIAKSLLPTNATEGWDKFFLGFDEHFNMLNKQFAELAKNVPTYPPINIRKTGDSSYVVEVAVAGFAKNDIEIEMVGDRLTIRGKTQDDTEDNYVFKGIAGRAFTRTFQLLDNLEVQNASLVNGMLKITLDGMVQAQKKLIPITE